jgi:hypothetical protein
MARVAARDVGLTTPVQVAARTGVDLCGTHIKLVS